MTINEHKNLHTDKTHIYTTFEIYEEHNITQFLDCVMWDQVSYGHNFASILECPIYGENSSYALYIIIFLMQHLLWKRGHHVYSKEFYESGYSLDLNFS